MERDFGYLIVDDEKSTRLIIETLMGDFENYHCLGNFQDPVNAVKFLKHHHCDLLFLDVEMPEMDGFALLDELEDPPMTIMVTGFATTYSEKAHIYYDRGIIDFVSKAMPDYRFKQAIQRFETQFANKLLINQYKDMTKQESMDSILLRDELFERSILKKDIAYISVEKNTLTLHTTSLEEIKMRGSLIDFVEQHFEPDSYVQISRMHVVIKMNIHSFNFSSISMGKDKNGESIILPISVRRRRETMKALSLKKLDTDEEMVYPI